MLLRPTGTLSLPDEFKSDWYDEDYFAGTRGGKAYRTSVGFEKKWSYFNPTGEWSGCLPIVRAWKEMFQPKNILDIGCGRGQFVTYARDLGIEAYGFDFSAWAIRNRYSRCRREWLKTHDATRPWPYPDGKFDLVVALDFFEHIYTDSIDFVVDEMFRVAKKWIFLQIATVDGIAQTGYTLRRGESIPLALEGNAVAGHVTVRTPAFWAEKFDRNGWEPRRDMVNWFCSLVDPRIITNWLKNSILVYGRVD